MVAGLNEKAILLAIGNDDVPIGQYTQMIFDHFVLDEASLAADGVLTYGSNVKEVTTQISEGTVDCGIIYSTDAYSAGLMAVDIATPEMCGWVIYPAAILKNSKHPDEAKAFLDYLQTPDSSKIFESVGFITKGSSVDQYR
jgi:molybdate transport system substrate-binding protein